MCIRRSRDSAELIRPAVTLSSTESCKPTCDNHGCDVPDSRRVSEFRGKICGASSFERESGKVKMRIVEFTKPKRFEMR
jgi:hypothetical protein